MHSSSCFDRFFEKAAMLVNTSAVVHFGAKAIPFFESFPNYLRDDVEVVSELYRHKELCREEEFLEKHRVLVDNDSIILPTRVYRQEPTRQEEARLTKVQRNILNCILTRHHDGFVRQRRAEQLVNCAEIWVAPYLVALLGEYVDDIIKMMDELLSEDCIVSCSTFINRNPKFWYLTEQRIISYWNEYYRVSAPNIKGYVGYKLAEKMRAPAKVRSVFRT